MCNFVLFCFFHFVMLLIQTFLLQFLFPLKNEQTSEAYQIYIFLANSDSSSWSVIYPTNLVSQMWSLLLDSITKRWRERLGQYLPGASVDVVIPWQSYLQWLQTGSVKVYTIKLVKSAVHCSAVLGQVALCPWGIIVQFTIVQFHCRTVH